MPRRKTALLTQGYEPHPWQGRLRLWVIVDSETGERRAVYGYTEAECYQKADALLRRLEAGTDLGSAKTTLAEYADYWLNRVMPKKVTPKSLRNYREELGPPLRHLGKKRLEKITELDVERAILAIADEVSDRAAVKGWSHLKRVLNHARQRRRIPHNPADIECPVTYSSEAFSVWSGEEMLAFLAAAESSSFYPLFYTALSLGMRSGEMFALPRKHVYLEQRKLEVRRTTTTDDAGRLIIQERPKTHYSARTLDLSEEHAALLAEHLAGLPDDPDALALPNAAGKPHDYSNVRRALGGIARRAGVRVIRPHDLRHTFASLYIATMCERGEFDIYSFSRDIMGHQNAAFTMRQYGHVVQRYQRSRRAYSVKELAGVE